ncbi:MAG: type II toxin-antitoxin system VapC family toxin [Acidimicrobiales bacterium]
MALVVDASALVYAMLGGGPSAAGLRERLGAEDCHAPHLIDAEVGNVLRRRVLRAEIVSRDAELLLTAGSALIDHRYEMTGSLARAAWARHRNLSFYDALYVALAAALSAPLLTVDQRLSRAPDLGCTVERVAGD